MAFRRSGTHYGETPEPVTPYQKAAQLWDERLGSARVQARNWRMAAFLSLGLSLVLTGGLVWQAGRSTITPWVVEVDKSGQVRAIGEAMENWNPTDAQIAFHLARFVSAVRSLPMDPIVVRQNWLEAYDFATDRGAQALNEYARADDPFAKVGRVSVAVEITSVVRASPDSFQIRWIEKTFTDGALSTTDRWTAIVSIVLERPRNADRLRKNPLGIYVNGLNWSRELGLVPAPSSRPGDRP
ncbi:MAG: conjugal transfer protein TrbF [Sphingobium sp.]